MHISSCRLGIEASCKILLNSTHFVLWAYNNLAIFATYSDIYCKFKYVNYPNCFQPASIFTLFLQQSLYFYLVVFKYLFHYRSDDLEVNNIILKYYIVTLFTYQQLHYHPFPAFNKSAADNFEIIHCRQKHKEYQ